MAAAGRPLTDILYLYTRWKCGDDKDSNLDELEEYVEMLEEDDIKEECTLNFCENIIPFFKKRKYYGYYSFMNCLVYRIPLSPNPSQNPNYLCAKKLKKWEPMVYDISEPTFNYINTIYNIYELSGEWPKGLLAPQIKRKSKFNKKVSILEKCSDDYIKQNIGNIDCCGWPYSGYICGENIDSGACMKKNKRKTITSGKII